MSTGGFPYGRSQYNNLFDAGTQLQSLPSPTNVVWALASHCTQIPISCSPSKLRHAASERLSLTHTELLLCHTVGSFANVLPSRAHNPTAPKESDVRYTNPPPDGLARGLTAPGTSKSKLSVDTFHKTMPACRKSTSSHPGPTSQRAAILEHKYVGSDPRWRTMYDRDRIVVRDWDRRTGRAARSKYCKRTKPYHAFHGPGRLHFTSHFTSTMLLGIGNSTRDSPRPTLVIAPPRHSASIPHRVPQSQSTRPPPLFAADSAPRCADFHPVADTRPYPPPCRCHGPRPIACEGITPSRPPSAPPSGPSPAIPQSQSSGRTRVRAAAANAPAAPRAAASARRCARGSARPAAGPARRR
jgi:hypothetical protein